MQVIARSLAAPPVSPCASAGKPCGPHGTVHAHQPAPPCITATVRTATLGQHVPRVDSLESEDENPSSSTNDACEGIKQSRAVKPLGATTSPAAPSGASSTPVSDEATDLAKPPAIANATLVSVESMDGTLEGLEETSPSHPNEVLPHGGINSNPQAIDTAPVAAPTSTTLNTSQLSSAQQAMAPAPQCSSYPQWHNATEHRDPRRFSVSQLPGESPLRRRHATRSHRSFL